MSEHCRKGVRDQQSQPPCGLKALRRKPSGGRKRETMTLADAFVNTALRHTADLGQASMRRARSCASASCTTISSLRTRKLPAAKISTTCSGKRAGRRRLVVSLEEALAHATPLDLENHHVRCREAAKGPAFAARGPATATQGSARGLPGCARPITFLLFSKHGVPLDFDDAIPVSVI
jgi:hypothetical protein